MLNGGKLLKKSSILVFIVHELVMNDLGNDTIREESRGNAWFVSF